MKSEYSGIKLHSQRHPVRQKESFEIPNFGVGQAVVFLNNLNEGDSP